MNLNHQKILVTGAKGMLGCDLLPLLQAKNATILATARTATSVKAVEVKVLDITDYSAVRDCFTEFAPDIVINCAACTRVDDAEKEYDFAFDVNSYAPEFLADICKTFGSYLVHISTDYVFGGAKQLTRNTPYLESDEISPCGIYGHSKRFGELNIQSNLDSKYLILRTSWLHGIYGANFVDTMIKFGKEKGTVKVVSDQVGSPTWTGWLAEAIIKMIEKEAVGIFHLSSSGEGVSRYDFVKEIYKLAKVEAEIIPVTSEEFKRPAPRPLYSVLDVRKAESILGEKCISWQQGLEKHILAGI